MESPMDWKITPGSAGLALTETLRFFSLPSPKGGGPAGPEGFAIRAAGGQAGIR